MTTNLTLDPGFSGYKSAQRNGQGLKSYHLPAVVGIGSTEIGLLSGPKKRKPYAPVSVAFDGIAYLVGENVDKWVAPLERQDFLRLSGDTPDQRALLYATLAHYCQPLDEVDLTILLPVQVLRNETLAKNILASLRKAWADTHTFQVDGQAFQITINQITPTAQPIGTYLNAILDDKGQLLLPTLGKDETLAVVDWGFNTLDLICVENGRIAPRYSWGEAFGIGHAARLLADEVKRLHGTSLSLGQTDKIIQDAVAGKDNWYKPLALQTLGQTIGQGIGFINDKWGNGAQFNRVVSAGGALLLPPVATALSQQLPTSATITDPVMSNVLGVAKSTGGQ